MASLIERRYKKGTNFVKTTGPAFLEKGEAVVPAGKNPVNKPTKGGYLASAIEAMPDKPKMTVHARMDHPSPDMDSGYQKEQETRLKKEIRAMNEQIAGWDHEAVGNQALKSLKKELAVKKARLMECQAMMDE